MRRTPNHNFFARLHRKLAEKGPFQRSALNRKRSARTPDIEENVLHQVQETPSLSMRSVQHAVGFPVPASGGFSEETKCILTTCSVSRHFNRVMYGISALKRQTIWFQHAAAHFSRNVRNHLDVRFGQQWIGRGGPVRWPAQSPDLSCLDFFLWGHMKTLVYDTPVDNATRSWLHESQ
ncbi:hypothetical protein AVEN_174235-1 [Araneus ventricosus]|uniref:DUF4817 domain-containing protein n=1 Tax=Araneus ventricosus TaxID=182803 RepID=A0A4Y2NUS2_ARAVE|nr:hypothetical protein AVEN_174235-1 [Araneus ventricosus]